MLRNVILADKSNLATEQRHFRVRDCLREELDPVDVDVRECQTLAAGPVT